MIKSLIEDVTAVEVESKSGGDFKPLPKGNYVLKLKEVKDWETKVYPIMNVNLYDAKFQPLKDENGATVKETVTDVSVFTNNMTFEVIEPEAYAGRLVWHKLTTHPNKPWDVPSFLHAMGVAKLPLISVKTLIGNKCNAYINIRDYDVDVTDDDGITSTVKKYVNEIRSFKAYEENELDV